MNAERPPSPEAPLLGHYNHLFVANPNEYALGRDDGAYIRIKKPFTPQVRDELLRGRLTVGLYCLTPEGMAIGGVLDSDKEDGLTAMQQAGLLLREGGLTPLLEQSRRGGHLRICHEPMRPQVTTTLLRLALEQVGAEAEVFPKNGMSNLRAPLSRHPLTRRQYPFLDLNTLQPVARTVRGNLAYLQGVRRATHREIAEALAGLVAGRHQQRHEERHDDGHVHHERVPFAKPDIMAVVEADRKLEKVGVHFRALCPFHADSTPSLVVYPETQSFYCFSCHKGGDSVRYLSLKHNVSDADILRRLRQAGGTGHGQAYT